MKNRQRLLSIFNCIDVDATINPSECAVFLPMIEQFL